jgi:hypothetical protein
MNWFRWLVWSLALNVAFWNSFAWILGRSAGAKERSSTRLEVTRARANVPRAVARNARAHSNSRVSTPNRLPSAPRQTTQPKRATALVMLRPVAAPNVRRRKITPLIDTKPLTAEPFKKNGSSTND